MGRARQRRRPKGRRFGRHSEQDEQGEAGRAMGGAGRARQRGDEHSSSPKGRRFGRHNASKPRTLGKKSVGFGKKSDSPSRRTAVCGRFQHAQQ